MNCDSLPYILMVVTIQNKNIQRNHLVSYETLTCNLYIYFVLSTKKRDKQKEFMIKFKHHELVELQSS